MIDDNFALSTVSDIETNRALRLFLQRLDGLYPVREGILYGSRARQTHACDSDADLAIVLNGRPGDRRLISRDMAGIAFDVMLETGILVDALPLWDDDFDRPQAFRKAALIQAIRRDGLRFRTVSRDADRSY